MIVTLIGAILYLLESITDILLAEMYQELVAGFIGDPNMQAGLAQTMTVMGTIGILFSLVILGLLLYMYKNKPTKGHFIAILVISIAGFFLSSAFFSLVVLIVGSAIGIARTK